MKSDSHSRQVHNAERDFQVPPEALLDAMVVVDGRGRIIHANTRTETLFGFSHDELLGSPVEMLIPARFHRQHERERHAYQSHPHIRMMDSGLTLWALHKNGHEIPVTISLSPLER